MKKIFFIFFVTLLSLGSYSAQIFINKINPYPAAGPLILNSSDSIKILAVLVEFQEDNDNTTFGKGKFGSIYSKDYGDKILDPLPHDIAYFADHLQFAANYFKKVSDGKVNIAYTILPDVITVSKTMRFYSPPNNSDDLSPLGSFAEEVWQIADQTSNGIDFSSYNLFAIFHAGAGRDVNIPGSLGNEKDLPSVYLGYNALQKIFGESFSGFSVNDGNFFIKNSMILPETENRELSIIGGTVLLELTINGLITASIASHLGLPDLFDTQTGLSAIGRFGLMDGQAIFAYGGLFPPEPSAWEKIYLGWQTPSTLSPGNYKVNLTAKLAAAANDTTILKIPINSSEYYLVENRTRDVKGNGSILTYKLKGQTFTKTFLSDTSGYFSFAVDSIDGVVLDVDEYDWALPGSGIVIWHIDENIINQKLAENKINTDKLNRGVDVEEADGIQDIGEEFTTIFGDVVIGEGTEEDFWYSSNPAVLYGNKFTKDTKPSTNSNSGANSLISLEEFSDVSNKMSFNVIYGSDGIRLITSANLGLADGINKLTVLGTDSANYFYLISSADLYRYDSGGTLKDSVSNFSDAKPAVIYFEGKEYVVGSLNSKLNVFVFNTGNELLLSEDIGSAVTAPPVLRYVQNKLQILVGGSDGSLYIYDLFTGQVPTLQLSDKISIFDDQPVRWIASDGEFFSLISDDKIYESTGGLLQLSQTLKRCILTKNKNGEYLSVILAGDGRFYTVKKGLIQTQFQLSTPLNINSFILADLFRDGENYIIFNNGRQIFAYNLTGGTAVNFPFTAAAGVNFIGEPLAIDINKDLAADIVSFADNGGV